ncbi:MAG: type II secretion system protein [Phycisphaerae bacterium]|nr:type II secretion system protein [Phycisphaerae bacterium]
MPRAGGVAAPALVLVELLIVIVLISMMVALASLAFTPRLLFNNTERSAQQFMRVLKMALNASAESNQRYGVVLDFDEQMYAMMPYSTLDKDQILAEEPVLMTGEFHEDFQLSYVRFDDAQDTRNWDVTQASYFRVWLLAGRSGWQNGAKIVILDRDGNPYTIITNRFSKVITMVPGDMDILEPVDNVLF